MTPAQRFAHERRRQLQAGILIRSATLRELLGVVDTAAKAIEAAVAAQPSDFQSWRLRALQAEVRRVLGVLETDGARVLATGVDRSWSGGGDLVTAPLAAGGLDLTGRLPALDPRLLDALKTFQVDRIRDITTTAAARITSEISNAALGVQTPFQAASKVAEIMETPKARAGVIVRTELATAFADAGQQRMTQAVRAGVSGLQKMWRRSGKLHPRPTHFEADGQIVDVDKPFIVGGIEIPKPCDPSIPPGERINCGCSSLPHMRHWRLETPKPAAFAATEA